MPSSTPPDAENPEPGVDAQTVPAEAPSAAPAPPASVTPADTWEHKALYNNIIKALYALPSRFRTDLVISGVLATDLFTFNTSLGATIETQVVAALNSLREVWDADNQYSHYSFVRQSQRFPDVILRTAAEGVTLPIRRDPANLDRH